MTSLSTSIERIRRSHAELGTARFLLLNLVLFGWIALFFYLAVAAQWPAGCGMDGIVRTYACSVDLAATGAAANVALAAWLWVTPLLLLAAIARLARRKARR